MELLEKILTKDNLNKAYKKVYQNKGASGVDGISVYEKQFSDNSYGFRPNRSAEQAVIRALELLNDGNERWKLKPIVK